MDTMEALLTRRSIRKYRPEPVSIEDLKEILAAGATAPSAVNMQHWYFVAVQDPAALEEVKAIMGGVVEKFQPVLEERFSRHPEQIGITNRFLSTLGGAPVCLLVFMLKPDYPDRDGAMQSVSAAIENVLLAAWAKGIGSCWLCAPPRMGRPLGLRPCVPAPLRPRQGGVRGSGHPGLPRPAAQNAAPAGRPLSDRIRRSFH